MAAPMPTADSLPYAKEFNEAYVKNDKKRIKELMEMRKAAMCGDARAAPAFTPMPSPPAFRSSTAFPSSPSSNSSARPAEMAHQHQPNVDIIQQLLDMGFTQTQAMNAFKRESTLEKAIDWITSYPREAESSLSPSNSSMTGRTSEGGALATGGQMPGRATPPPPPNVTDVVMQQLMEHGVPQDQARQLASESAQRFKDDVGSAFAHALSKVLDSGPVMVQCPILLDEVSVDDAYLLECGDDANHWASIGGLKTSICTYVAEKRLPICPHVGCRRVLELNEIEQILNLYFDGQGPPPTQEEIKQLQLHRGLKRLGGEGWVSDLAARLADTLAWVRMSLVRCPRDGCGNWAEPSHPGAQEPCPCPCGMTYCTKCSRPYHYGCTCEEVMTLSRLWVEWRQHGMEQYLGEMARQDAHFDRAMEEFRNKKQQHERDAEIAGQNFRTFQEDERFKAQVCRRCPNCSRVVQHMGGCDAMVCGENYHGGDRQNGCGHRFAFSSAPPYEPDTGNRAEVPAFTDVPPAEVAQLHHYITEGEPERCSECNEPVVGPLAKCINCKGEHIRCVACQAKPHEDGSHIFRLVMEN